MNTYYLILKLYCITFNNITISFAVAHKRIGCYNSETLHVQILITLNVAEDLLKFFITMFKGK